MLFLVFSLSDALPWSYQQKHRQSWNRSVYIFNILLKDKIFNMVPGWTLVIGSGEEEVVVLKMVKSVLQNVNKTFFKIFFECWARFQFSKKNPPRFFPSALPFTVSCSFSPAVLLGGDSTKKKIKTKLK